MGPWRRKRCGGCRPGLRVDAALGGRHVRGRAVHVEPGQWQKLAIARAFMRLRGPGGGADAEVLILDEPTASIDTESEVALFERFKALAVDRSAIIISHRFSTVRMADRIAVLSGGRLMELGTHEELLVMAGRYAHLFTLQARAYR